MKDLVGLVTGGGSGFGKATAERFVHQGGKVVICDLSMSGGYRVAADLGPDAYFVACDVTSEADILNALKLTESQFGRLDAVVNCAGITKLGKIYDFETEKPYSLYDFVNIMNVNVAGTFNVVRLAAPLLAKNLPDKDGLRGCVINVSSIVWSEAPSKFAAYAASKAAIVGMTLPIARDFAEQGIRCNTISPGPFDTPFISSYPEMMLEFLRTTTTTCPARFGKPEEFAQMVEVVLTNHYINGAVIRLDGAFRM